MSDTQAQAAHGGDTHEGPIRTPRQLVWTIVAAFVVPVILIILLVNFVTSASKPGAGSDGLEQEAIERRLQRVGQVAFRDASAPKAVRTGEQVYKAVCTGCHAAAVAGAPKTGDAAAWAPRLKTGYDALMTSVLKGKGAMPAQGGGEYSDYELGRAVVWLTAQAGGTFAEPKAPEPPPAAADAAASATK